MTIPARYCRMFNVPAPLVRFLRAETAAMSIEAAIMLPIMMIMYIGAFSYFDAYRREAVITKATYAIGDLLSREEGTVTAVDFEGLHDLYETITFSEGATRLRFSEIRRVSGSLEVVWSYGTDGSTQLTTATLGSVAAQVPTLLDNERIVVVESFNDYEPAFNVGLFARTQMRFVPTRQRYAARLDYDASVPAPS
ncbi:TadE/TadG family type IV pilus assembly protein [Jannaschia sp. 2305UL9-9]|uniref:TadE/TadG family type IV pilus assembly protein n=1 Tax=Jannaschia sp. 2305UL9-9 TaxID=3121638 RepID=UPI0035274F3D